MLVSMSALAEPDEPFDTFQPFTRAAGVAAGIGKQLRTSAYRPLFRGIYIDAAVEVTPLILARASLLPFRPLARASHATAARVLRLPIPVLPDEHVTVVEPKERRSRSGIVCHLGHDGPVMVVDGIRVSSPPQVFVELATLLSLVDLVVVGDHLVRHGWISVAALQRFCAAASGPGASAARAAVGYVRERVDSPMETRLRMLIVLAGLPEPEVNLLVGDGVEFRKYDLSYRRSKTIVEYDGRQHAERVKQWESDLERRERIDDDEWRILVVIAKGIYSEPERTLQRVHRVLLKRGEPGVPARLSDEWRRHFPGH